MALVAVIGPKGSPGATTLATAMAAAWPAIGGRRRLLLEADPDGGVLAVRLGLSLGTTLAELAASGRHGFSPGVLDTCAVPLDEDGLAVLLAPASAEHGSTVLGRIADPLAAFLAATDTIDVVADVGRLAPGSPSVPLAQRAVATLVVVRPRFDELAIVKPRIEQLHRLGCDVRLVVEGTQPESPDECASVLGVPLAGVVPHDRKVAAAASSGRFDSRAVQRSLWWRAVRTLVTDLVTEVAATGGGHAPLLEATEAGGRRRRRRKGADPVPTDVTTDGSVRAAEAEAVES